MVYKLFIILLTNVGFFWNLYSHQVEIESGLTHSEVMQRWNKHVKDFTKTIEIVEQMKVQDTILREVMAYYDYENWSGKSSESKGIIVFQKDFFEKNNITGLWSHNDMFFTFLTMYQKTEDTHIRVTISVYDDCKNAQIGLLGTIMVTSGPWPHVNEDFKVGDITLSYGKDEFFSLYFVQNNVLVELNYGEKERILELAGEIDSIIKNAPPLDLKDEFDLPALVITPEVASEFQTDIVRTTSIGPEIEVVPIHRVEVKPGPKGHLQRTSEIAKKYGIECDVIVKALVDTNGTVIEVEILESSGHKIFDEEAIRIAKTYKFAQGRPRGKFPRVWVTIPIKFRLDE